MSRKNRHRRVPKVVRRTQPGTSPGTIAPDPSQPKPTIDVIAYPGDHTAFEAPALVSGRRLRGSRQAEVGSGLADALGLAPGSTLALALPSGSELRLRVAGIAAEHFLIEIDDPAMVGVAAADLECLIGADERRLHVRAAADASIGPGAVA